MKSLPHAVAGIWTRHVKDGLQGRVRAAPSLAQRSPLRVWDNAKTVWGGDVRPWAAQSADQVNSRTRSARDDLGASSLVTTPRNAASARIAHVLVAEGRKVV